MTWLLSKAFVNSLSLRGGEESSAESYSDGEPSVLSSGSPTPPAYCAPDKMTAFSRLSRFGMTFKPLTECRGKELLTSYLAGFPAKTYPLPEKARASTESAQACGRTWPASLAKFDPATSSWKTAQPSLLGDLEESSVTWPRSGMTAAGRCWELPTLARRTSATASGLLPAPTANQFDCKDVPRLLERREKSKAKGKNGNGFGLTLAQHVRVEMWPTPTCHNAKETNSPSEAVRNTPSLAAQVGGKLNPTWVEWLMGWPLGWTDLKHSATDKCPDAQPQLSAC